MNVLEIAKKNFNGSKITEGLSNEVEMAVRAYDPCLSCATHQINRPGSKIKVYNSSGICIDSKEE